MKTRSLQTILLASAMFLAGCQLYVKDRNRGDDYSFCDRTGCFECDEFECYEVNPAGDGESCATDFDCMAGCYCAKGVDGGLCIEAGFCRSDRECEAGYACQMERTSCAPDVSCTSNEDCESGFCGDAGTCAPGGSCGPDGECGAGEVCDERNMCVPEAPPSSDPTCQGAVTCEESPPFCGIGFAATIQDGCYTGDCVVNDECPDDNPCESNNRDQCASDQEVGRCSMVFSGVNCTSPSGDPCDLGEANCSCERYQYSGCQAAI